MQELLVHSIWLVTHFLRSFFEARSTEALADSLSLEVRALQAELHHTQRVLSGYSTVLERCEVRGNTQVWVHTLLVLVIGILVIFWFGNLAAKQFKQPAPRPIAFGDTGGSSDSEGPTEQPATIPVKSLTTGPIRPSQLAGKGRK